VTKFFPEALFELGYTDLVSVIPPDAELTPSSKIAPTQVGKVPGHRLSNGLWAGYDWRRHVPTIDDVRGWCLAGANVGIRADRFPGVDIDSLDEGLAKSIEDAAIAFLGPAPQRMGRYPKRLLMYRTAEPFSRMRLWIARNGENHLVEILGQGQQYLVHGTHPTTRKPYEWDKDLATYGPLTEISREQASAFLDHLAELVEVLGVGKVEREGDGRPLSRVAAENQGGLLAPSLDLLREAVRAIPNTNALFPDRTSYLRMGYAIRAAGAEDLEEAFNIYAEWAAKWEGNDRVKGNDPDTVLGDWRRFRGPYAVGWNWIAEQARGFGFDTATIDFEVLSDAVAPAADKAVEAAYQSDQWLADRIVTRIRGVLRYIPQEGKWVAWNRGRWQRDAELLAEDIIKRELRIIADETLRRGVTDDQKKAALKAATAMCSATKLGQVLGLIKSDRAVAVSMPSLDHDTWVLNTPAGIVNLKTGELAPPAPDALCTKITAVAPDFQGACPEWKRFLAETTRGDRELEAYLQRLCGYALTGSTDEQNLVFIWGPGGNGKSLFINVLSGVLGDYARVATMDTFTASYGDKHTTDIAMLVGARLVTASETQSGKRWDDQRVKSLTGGEPVTARFMRQDNFTFLPQFKLIFIGNHKPEIRDVDEAMRRRIQLVPFTVTPAKIDKQLGAKLRDEWPAILAWMVEGCLAWQQHGLNPPARVKAATEEYFEAEDAVGRWLAECTVASEANTTSQELYQSWTEWANGNGEYRGSMKRLVDALVRRKLARWQDPKTRRKGFAGISIVPRNDFEIAT
jgi:P4 family phage/plasmid primase-like protien